MSLWIPLARGTGEDLLERQGQLVHREGLLPEGSRVELRLRSPVSLRWALVGAAATLSTASELAGSHLSARVDEGAPVLRIRWTKGQPWVGVVIRVLVAAVAGFALGVLIASWLLAGALGPEFLLFVGGSLVAILLVQRARARKEASP